MKFLKKYNESKDFDNIEDDVRSIFLDLTDNSIDVKFTLVRDFYKKPIGLSIELDSGESEMSLSYIYMYILTCMDYMRTHKMILKKIYWSTDLRYPVVPSKYDQEIFNKMYNYFYDYMRGDQEKRDKLNLSFNKFTIRFE